jgi:hypothetical protein
MNQMPIRRSLMMFRDVRQEARDQVEGDSAAGARQAPVLVGCIIRPGER